MTGEKGKKVSGRRVKEARKKPGHEKKWEGNSHFIKRE